MPTPQLRVASRSGCDTPPTRRTTSKTGCGVHVARSSSHRQLLGQHPLEVVGQPAAGDVRHRVGPGRAGERRGRPWRRSGSARAAPRPGCGRTRRRAGRGSSRPSLKQDVADQRVAVGVQAAGRHRDHHVAGPHPAGAEQLRRPRPRRWWRRRRRTRRGRGARGARRSRRRSSAQPATTQASAMPLTIAAIRSGTTLPVGDVVGHEERLGAADDEVVDDHADQVEPDRVVLVHHLRDGDLGADAVGGGGEQRPLVRRQRARVEQAREATEAADHLGPAGLLDPDLHQVDGPVGGLDVDAGAGVGRCRARRAPQAGSYGLLRTGRASPWIGDWQRRLEEVLAEEALARAAGWGRRRSKQAVHRLCPSADAGGLDHALERDVAQGVGADARGRSRRRRGRWRSARHGSRSRCRRSTATSPAGSEIRTWTSSAPASRSIRISARWVLPRTIESSTTTSRLPRSCRRAG